jgi:capsular polysaccharide biosynthesis protein
LGCSETALRNWQRQLSAGGDDGPRVMADDAGAPNPLTDDEVPAEVAADDAGAPNPLTDDEVPVEVAGDSGAGEPLAGGPAPRSAPTVVEVLRGRWWVVALVTAIAILSAWAYSQTVPARYQATATVLAHPAANVTSASDYSTDLSLLSYGSLEQTFVGLASSSKLRNEAAAGIGLRQARSHDYSAVASVLPASSVLEISVAGPDRNTVVPFANRLASAVSAATRLYFPIFTLTPLDPAVPPSAQIEPRTRQNVLVGGLAGLIAGFGVAVLSLRIRSVGDGRVGRLAMRLRRARA